MPVNLFAVKRLLIRPLRRALSPLLDRAVYTIRCGPATGMKRRGGVGFLRRPPTREEQLLMSQELTGRTVCDVGAYHGVMTLFFARAVGDGGRVFAFEPNPGNHRRVVENVRLNWLPNVEVLPCALGATPGHETLAFSAAERAMGSAQPDLREEILAGGGKTVEIRVESLDHLVEEGRVPPPDFIKLDVEGFEFEALRGMERTLRNAGPRLLVEIHGAGLERKEENARQVVAFLERCGYIMRHVESDRPIASGNAADAREGHLFCEHRAPRG